jgi:hypothetical protein
VFPEKLVRTMIKGNRDLIHNTSEMRKLLRQLYRDIPLAINNIVTDFGGNEGTDVSWNVELRR